MQLITDWVFWLVARQNFFGIVIGIVRRTITQRFCFAVVPPNAAGGADAPDDLGVNIWMGEPDIAELNEIFLMQPDRQTPLVCRCRPNVSDADRKRTNAVFVGIKAGERLAESL